MPSKTPYESKFSVEVTMDDDANSIVYPMYWSGLFLTVRFFFLFFFGE